MNQMEYPLHNFNQKENSKFKRCSTLEIHRLLVALLHSIRRYPVRISTLCMGGSLYCIFVFSTRIHLSYADAEYSNHILHKANTGTLL